MSKKTDLFVVIIFSIIWVVRPISYGEMKSRHLNRGTNNTVLLSNSYIRMNAFESDVLTNDYQKIIFATDTGKSGSFFAEGFQPPLSRRPRHEIATGMSGSNPGSGGGSSNPGSGSGGASCSPNPTNPTPKFAPKVVTIDSSKKKSKKKKNKSRNSHLDRKVELNGHEFTIERAQIEKKNTPAWGRFRFRPGDRTRWPA